MIACTCDTIILSDPVQATLVRGVIHESMQRISTVASSTGEFLVANADALTMVGNGRMSILI